MSRHYLRLVSADDAVGEPLTAFLDDLTTICRRHGIAINGGAELYLMESEDFQFVYSADGESRLFLSSEVQPVSQDGQGPIRASSAQDEPPPFPNGEEKA